MEIGRYVRSDGTGVESVFGYVSLLDLMVSRLVTTKSMEVQTIMCVVWKTGGSPSSNSDGTITSNVSETPPMVFRY